MKSKFLKRFVLIQFKNKEVFKACLAILLFFEDLSKSRKMDLMRRQIGNYIGLKSESVIIQLRILRLKESQRRKTFGFIQFATTTNV